MRGVEAFAFGGRLGEVAREGRRIHGRVEVVQVPFRQGAESGRGLRLRARPDQMESFDR